MTSSQGVDYVGVVIPACNEERTIGRCIQSVRDALKACELMGQWIVVVADCCDDRTVELAREALGDAGEVSACLYRSPGSARRLGANILLHHYRSIPPEHIWLANTDADSHVPSDWIAQQLGLSRQGVSAIAGIVSVDSFEGNDARAETRFAASYPIHADGSHPHVHGANMGVRADAYLDAGGWSNLSVGEDHCLWRRVQGRGWSVRSTSASVVTTSGRLFGRAHGGFADNLRAANDFAC